MESLHVKIIGVAALKKVIRKEILVIFEKFNFFDDTKKSYERAVKNIKIVI